MIARGLREDADFAFLRGNAEFEAILQKFEQAAAPGPKPVEGP